MGLIAKSRTKKRIAPEQGPAHRSLSGSPWLTTGAIPMEHLVRSAVMSLELGNTTSDTVRGKNSLLGGAVAAALTGASSSLWVETDDFKEWSLILGVMALNGTVAADWAVQVAVSPPTAAVGTSHWLTNDDELVNGDQHDTLRRALLDTLASGRPAREDAEAEVTRASMELVQPFPSPPPEPGEVTFAIETTLPDSARLEVLGTMGARVLATTPTGFTWALGLPTGGDHLTLTVAPGGLTGRAVIASTSSAARRIAAQALRSLIARSMFLLKQKGEAAASYSGPAELRLAK